MNNIVEKLRKVLALTNSPIEAEAQAAAEHLQRLLIAHNLDMADLELKGHQKAPGVKEEKHDLGKAAFKWKLALASDIAEHYFCVALVTLHDKQVRFVGRPDNVAALRALYAWIIDQIAAIAREERRKHYKETGEHIDPLRWQVNFGLGAVGRLRTRLQELKQRQAESVSETALVVHHLAEVSDYLEERYGFRRDGRDTKYQQERKKRREEEEKEWQKLKETDPEAYYTARPWERPETEKEKKAREKKEKKENERYWARAHRRVNRILTPEQLRKQEQEQQAKAAGRAGADRVNLEPFLKGKRKEAELGS